MSVKISELPLLEQTASTDLLEISASNTSYRMTRSTFIAGIAEETAAVTPTEVNGTSYTLAQSDEVLLADNSSTQTITVPSNASVAVPVGRLIQIIRVGSGNVDIAAAGGVTINTDRGLTVDDINATGWLRKTDTDEWTFNSNSAYSIASTITGTSETITTAAAGTHRKYTSSSPVTVTFSDTERMPSNSEITLRKAGTGAVTVTRAGSTITFNGATSFTLTGTAWIKREASSTDYIVEGETGEDVTFSGAATFDGGLTVSSGETADFTSSTVDFTSATLDFTSATLTAEGPFVTTSSNSGNDIAVFTGTGNEITGNNNFIWNDSSSIFEFKSQNTGAAHDPTLRAVRESATPADGDGLLEIISNADDDAASEVEFGALRCIATTVANGSHAGRWDVVTAVAGTPTVQASFRDNKVFLFNLPTSDPTAAGQLWSNSGVLTVSSG